jgi:hypothetical protein
MGSDGMVNWPVVAGAISGAFAGAGMLIAWYGRTRTTIEAAVLARFESEKKEWTERIQRLETRVGALENGKQEALACQFEAKAFADTMADSAIKVALLDAIKRGIEALRHL